MVFEDFHSNVDMHNTGTHPVGGWVWELEKSKQTYRLEHYRLKFSSQSFLSLLVKYLSGLIIYRSKACYN